MFNIDELEVVSIDMDTPKVKLKSGCSRKMYKKNLAPSPTTQYYDVSPKPLTKILSA